MQPSVATNAMSHNNDTRYKSTREIKPAKKFVFQWQLPNSKATSVLKIEVPGSVVDGAIVVESKASVDLLTSKKHTQGPSCNATEKRQRPSNEKQRSKNRNTFTKSCNHPGSCQMPFHHNYLKQITWCKAVFI